MFSENRFGPYENTERKRSPTADNIFKDASRTNTYRRKKWPTIGELLDLSNLSDCYVYDPFLDRQKCKENKRIILLLYIYSFFKAMNSMYYRLK